MGGSPLGDLGNPSPSAHITLGSILQKPGRGQCRLSVAPPSSDICISTPVALDSQRLILGNKLSSLYKLRQRLELGIFRE